MPIWEHHFTPTENIGLQWIVPRHKQKFKISFLLREEKLSCCHRAPEEPWVILNKSILVSWLHKHTRLWIFWAGSEQRLVETLLRGHPEGQTEPMKTRCVGQRSLWCKCTFLINIYCDLTAWHSGFTVRWLCLKSLSVRTFSTAAALSIRKQTESYAMKTIMPISPYRELKTSCLYWKLTQRSES